MVVLKILFLALTLVLGILAIIMGAAFALLAYWELTDPMRKPLPPGSHYESWKTEDRNGELREIVMVIKGPHTPWKHYE